MIHECTINLKINADSVNSGDSDFALVLSFLDTSSFPLKFLRTNISNTSAYFACGDITKKLVIPAGEVDIETSERITDVLFHPRNQNIVFENFHLEAEGMTSMLNFIKFQSLHAFRYCCKNLFLHFIDCFLFF